MSTIKANRNRLEQEFRNLCRRYKTLIGRSGLRMGRLTRLKKKLKYLYQSLLPKYGRSSLIKVPGAALFCISMMAGSQVSGQSFAAHIDNPFGFSNQNVENANTPNLVDLDNDGDFDLMTIEFYNGYVYYENIGTVEVPEFTASQLDPFGLQLNENHGYATPVFADMDNDGDLDLIVSEHDDLLYAENIGTAEAPQFGPQESNKFGLSLGTYLNLDVADWDDDGDLDLMGSTYENHVYYENVGTAEEAIFTDAVRQPFNLPASNYLSLCSADLDDDGDLDLFGTELFFSANTTSNFNYYENSGIAESPSFEEMQVNPFGLNYVESVISSMSCADMDNDGDVDIMTTEYSFTSGNVSFIRYYENISELSSSVSLLPDDLKVSIFPTITEGPISIESNYPITSIEVTDLSGRLILDSERSTLSLNTMSSGVYNIRLNYKDGYVMKRVVKK